MPFNKLGVMRQQGIRGAAGSGFLTSLPRTDVLTTASRDELRADLQDVNFDRLDDQSPMDNAVSIGFPIRR